jgi:circadian clock protein KaiB
MGWHGEINMTPQLTVQNLELFKGIALFTPGGDLIYCVDPAKQTRWHLHLCLALQQILDLPEPPHFLVPCYTATVDRWRDPRNQQIQTLAEAAPAVLKHQVLLNALFGLEHVVWRVASIQEGLCDPIVLSTYRQQFPQLWETHDLVVLYNQAASYLRSSREHLPRSTNFDLPHPEAQGYVLRLFVSGHTVATERTLQTLHHLLERSLGQPYTLKVIDVLQNPDQAEQDQVSATPTLVRVWPRPLRRVVGDLENVDQLLRMLGPLEEGGMRDER